MKYFAVILTALLAIGQAASVPQQAAALDSLILETTVDKPTFNTTELIDGRRRISFYSNGVFAGSLTEGKPGSADNLIYVDPFSNTVSESELLATSTQLGGGAGTADVLATKPSSLSKLLEKFAALTKKYGPRFFVRLYLPEELDLFLLASRTQLI